MSDRSDELIQALRRAIQAEHEGHSFYQMAAESTSDEKGKKVFEALAAEELDHARFLSAHYKAVAETGKIDSSAQLAEPVDLGGSSPIFSDDLRARIKEAHYEMTSLSIGIQLEQNAMEFYQRQAEKAEDADVSQLFAFLAKWETGHYRALLGQYDLLKDDYWSAGGFAPF